MFRFGLSFGNKKNAANSKPSEDWLDEYLSEDDDDDNDFDDDEDEDDFYDSLPFVSFDYNAEDSEGLDAHEASYIWMSSGKDEDYTFGFSEDELEDAK